MEQGDKLSRLMQIPYPMRAYNKGEYTWLVAMLVTVPADGDINADGWMSIRYVDTRGLLYAPTEFELIEASVSYPTEIVYNRGY